MSLIDREKLRERVEAAKRAFPYWPASINDVLALIDAAPPADPVEGLDVRLVVKAIENVARRHGVVKTPPVASASLATIYGYSTTIADMDAQIAAEYAALRAASSEGQDPPARDIVDSTPDPIPGDPDWDYRKHTSDRV